MPVLKVNHKLRKFLEIHKPLKVAIGGRGSGKSIGFGDMLTLKMDTEQADIYCLREYQDSLSDSVHRVFKDSITKRLGLAGWDIQNNTIIAPNGACTKYVGASRNTDSIQSAQSYKYSWFEEAHRASQASLDKLLPTILRNPGAECWFSANPQSSADPFSQRFIEPYKTQLDLHGFYEDDMHLIVVINWRDNPWWNEDQERLRAWDYEHLERAKYDWIWEGSYNDTVEGSIIKPEWFDASIDAHKKLGFKPRGARIASFDPSDEGEDDKGLFVRHGSVVVHADYLTKGDAADGLDWALDYVSKNNIDFFTWDCDGLGVALKRQVDLSLRGTRTRWEMFKGSEGVDHPGEIFEETEAGNNKTNEETFRNKRAQYYWSLRDRFYNTYRAVEHNEYHDPDKMIGISSEIKCIPALRAEICRVPRKHNTNGLIQIMSKEDMQKLGIKSPNLADSAMMSMRFIEEKKDEWWDKPIEISTRYVV